MNIIINNKNYSFLIGYQEEADLRNAFNELTQKTFGISFEQWYQPGYWNEDYIPYTLFDSGKAVSTISVNKINFNILGEQKCTIQIGTGMTDESYRKQNLFSFLINYILEKWKDKCDFIYFFANNNSLLEMYSKLGFTPVKEYAHYKSISPNKSTSQVQKLDMDIEANRDMLYDYAKNSVANSKISMKSNTHLVMFYCTSFFKDNIYYIEELETIAIATYDKQELNLIDVFCKSRIEIDRVIDVLSNKNTTEVLLGFTPLDCAGFQYKEINSGETLFVPENLVTTFITNKLRFPLLSHA